MCSESQENSGKGKTSHWDCSAPPARAERTHYQVVGDYSAQWNGNHRQQPGNTSQATSTEQIKMSNLDEIQIKPENKDVPHISFERVTQGQEHEAGRPKNALCSHRTCLGALLAGPKGVAWRKSCLIPGRPRKVIPQTSGQHPCESDSHGWECRDPECNPPSPVNHDVGKQERGNRRAGPYRGHYDPVGQAPARWRNPACYTLPGSRECGSLSHSQDKAQYAQYGERTGRGATEKPPT